MSAVEMKDVCKICGGQKLEVIDHTAKCKTCGVLLYFPYPENVVLEAKNDPESVNQYKKKFFYWYQRSSVNNHKNFTDMIQFTVEDSRKQYTQKLDILDYGGGGGQFAMVCKSLLPLSEVFITDINDHILIDAYKCVNNQISWNSFKTDSKRFDFIFLNDVFEHVSDPVLTLKTLTGKLNPGGKIFIDTPIQFWIYPVLHFSFRPLYRKLLKGTVSQSHLQIWTKDSFFRVVEKSGLKIIKYENVNEYTMDASHYLRNIGIKNNAIQLLGKLFYKLAGRFTKNKIVCLLEKQ
jgi:2-polyprenyl-3-methyl-5-hydroxy-6-metoxy-1,4-benzoquinol methylase